MLTTPTTLARAPAAARCAVRGSRVVARATAAARPRAPTPAVPPATTAASYRCPLPHPRDAARRVADPPRDPARPPPTPPWSTAYPQRLRPLPMDTSALQSELLVLAVIAVMTAYWWYVLVPGARVNLAVNKRTGKLRDYLEELKADDDRKLERFFYQKWLAKVDPETRYLLRDDDEDASDDGSRAGAADPPRTKPRVSLADTEGVTRDVGRRAWRISSERRKKHQSFGAGIIPCWWAPPSPSARRPSSASSRTDQSGAGGDRLEDPIPSSTSTTRDAIVVAL